MSTFKRVSLGGSGELLGAASPRLLDETQDTITGMVDHTPKNPQPRDSRELHLTLDEIQLLLEAIQVAKYPERAKSRLPLDKFERYDALRNKLQGERGAG